MNMKTVCAAILAGAVIAGCGTKDEKPAKDEAVLSVNGKVLMRSQVDADVAAILKAQGDKIPAGQAEYAKQSFQNQIGQSFVIETVLVAKAKELGYQVTDADRKAREAEFLKAVSRTPDAPKTLDEYFQKFPLGAERGKKEFEDGILIDKMLKAEHAKAAPKTDYAAEAKKQIEKIVAENAAAAKDEGDALKKIKDLKAQLDKVPAADVPVKFAELAKANSACPSSSKGGDLGEFQHGMMVPEFDKVAFALPVNKVSDPVKTQFGYHLIMVTKKVAAVAAKDGKPAAPEKVQASHILIKAGATRPVPKAEEVVEQLKKREERKFMQEFVMGQVRAAKIEAFAEDFKQFVPPKDEPVAKKAPVAKKVETPVQEAKKAETAKKEAAPVAKPAGK